MFLTVGMTLGIRGPAVGPLKDVNFRKHSGTPLAVLVYVYTHDTNNDSNHLEPSDRAMMIILVCLYVYTYYMVL